MYTNYHRIKWSISISKNTCSQLLFKTRQRYVKEVYYRLSWYLLAALRSTLKGSSGLTSLAGPINCL